MLQQLDGEVDELRYEYFTPPLLTEYQEHYGELSGLYYDPRGVLIEPHSGQEIPLGTRDVDAYDIPMWEYNKLLYIEKKGFLPILQQAKIPQRYDIAIMAAEGYATRAAKIVLNSIHKDTEFDILALHDADVDGMMIKYTLERETRTSKDHHIKIIDIGLRPSEALKMNLESEKVTRQKSLPRELLQVLTKDEIVKKGNPIGGRQLNYLMKKYCKKVGIPKEKAHFHSLRHSIGVHLMDAGADVLFVRDILGHKNIQNTLIYAQITSSRRDEIHRQLLGSSRIV